MRWTYKGAILTENSPEVHCVDKLECHVMNKIQKANLKGSFLNEQFLPTCQDGGILLVQEGSAKETNLVNVTCDASTGRYSYRAGNGNFSIPVTSSTIFSCF
ncbi:hypothetical protein PFISCL1PPCAC_4487, partial [Pristionchus fissidentatus]